MMSKALFLLTAMALAPQSTSAMSHGTSGFALSRTHKFRATHASTLEEKNQCCQEEYGHESRILDLADMDHEFHNKNPEDLKHALNPLFNDVDHTHEVFFVANHGQDFSGTNALLDRHEKYVLAKGHVPHGAGDETRHSEFHKRQQVADDIYLEVRHDTSIHDASVLCYVGKPHYNMGMAQSGGGTNAPNKSFSWAGFLLIVCAVAAAMAVGYRNYKKYSRETAQLEATLGGYEAPLGAYAPLAMSAESVTFAQPQPPFF